MGLFNWLQRKKKIEKNEKQNDEKVDETIVAYDKYGQQFHITKEDWKENVLIGNLEKVRNNPDELYGMIVSALHDGFFREATKYCEILLKIDPNRSRATTVLGIAYMNSNRLEDAERVFADFIKSFGDHGTVLTNLAKVYAAQGKTQQADSTLWRALEADPNQENGLDWYAAQQREIYGDAALVHSLSRVAALPNSWRARLLLARFALEQGDLAKAKTFYSESLEKAGSPVPEDLLMQMSGDLGNNGYLNEVIDMVQPRFQASVHGISIGNNLLKANIDLNRLDDARIILQQLYDLQRPDWRDMLSFWTTEIAKKEITLQKDEQPESETVVTFSMEGPIWCRDKSPFAALVPEKKQTAVKIFIFGSTVIHNDNSEAVGRQIANATGRASRGIPLLISEQINLLTEVESEVLIPWMQPGGFAVFGKAYGHEELCGLVDGDNERATYLLQVIINADHPTWRITVEIIRVADRVEIEKFTAECMPENIGPAALHLCKDILSSLVKHLKVAHLTCPSWYAIPSGPSTSEYLLRLEQLLSVTCVNQSFLEGGGLYGEHEIIEGNIFLNLTYPENKTLRMLFVQTLLQMKKYKPALIDSFKEKAMLLQKEHGLNGTEGELISKAMSELF